MEAKGSIVQQTDIHDVDGRLIASEPSIKGKAKLTTSDFGLRWTISRVFSVANLEVAWQELDTFTRYESTLGLHFVRQDPTAGNLLSAMVRFHCRSIDDAVQTEQLARATLDATRWEATDPAPDGEPRDAWWWTEEAETLWRQQTGSAKG